MIAVQISTGTWTAGVRRPYVAPLVLVADASHLDEDGELATMPPDEAQDHLSLDDQALVWTEQIAQAALALLPLYPGREERGPVPVRVMADHPRVAHLVAEHLVSVITGMGVTAELKENDR